MWSVIGEVFFFRLIYFLLFSFLVCIKNQLLVRLGGHWGLPPYPQQCEGHASRIMWGMSQTMCGGHHGTWSENNKCLGLNP